MALITKLSSGGGSSASASDKAQSFFLRNWRAFAVATLICWIVMTTVWFGGLSDDSALAAGSSSSSSSGGGADSSSAASAEAEAAAEARKVAALLDDAEEDFNRHDTSAVKEWRKLLQKQCDAASSVAEVHAVGKAARDKFTLPMSGDIEAEARRRAFDGEDFQMRRCKLVVMDFGANVGDTMAHMMDAGLVRCDKTRKLGGNAKSESHFDQAEFALKDKNWNRVTRWLMGMVEDVSKAAKDKKPVGPEDYCYYGVEGNPVFTERLKKAEAWAHRIDPRPLRHAHFLTEHVGAGKDGPTQLWLDTVNTKENFWGSSIFKTHQDVKKSSTNSTAKAADVQGITITTLMKKTLKAFDPKASEDDKTGGHLLLKVDIEGGEYPLVEEVAESNALCDYVKMGNRADLLIEFHSVRVTGVGGLGPKVRKHREKLEKCGVQFRQLQAWWN